MDSKIINKKHRLTNKHREWISGYGFILLWIIGFIVFTLLPMAQSLMFSFQKIDITAKGMNSKFINFKNYSDLLLADPVFMDRLISYIKSMILNVPIAIVFALVIAILINQNIRFKGIWRMIFFLPVVISTGPVINQLTAQGVGTIPALTNSPIMTSIQNDLPSFIADPIVSLFSSIIVVLWFTGIQILIFLAGLQKVDRSIYEAAAIDGASPWESFWKITLPAVRQLIMVNIVYTIVTMSVFSNSLIIQYIEQKKFDYLTGYGYANAIAWIYFIVITLEIIIFLGLLNLKRD